MSFSQKLKRLRAEHHMTQAELGRQINVARATIAGYESRNRQPSHEKLTAISQLFDVTVDYLLDPDDEPAESEAAVRPGNPSDARICDLYQKLTPRSRQDAYQYLQLLELRDRYDGDSRS